MDIYILGLLFLNSFITKLSLVIIVCHVKLIFEDVAERRTLLCFSIYLYIYSHINKILFNLYIQF